MTGVKYHQGVVLEVDEVREGSDLKVAAALGATDLQLYDTTAFNDEGGQVEIDGTIYTYLSKDDDTNTMKLSSGLVLAAEVDEDVFVYPYSYEKQATIQVDDEDPPTAVVPQDLYDAFPLGVRVDADQESVTAFQDGNEWYIRDIHRQRVARDGAFLDPVTVPPAIPEAPTVSAIPVVMGGVGSLYVTWAPVTDTFGLVTEVHMSTTSGFTPGPTTLVKEVEGTMTTISKEADGDPLQPPPTIYYIKLITKNVTGAAAPSSEAEGQLRQITGPDISVNAAWVGTMTVDRLLGGHLTAEALLAGDGGIRAVGADGRQVAMHPGGFEVLGPTSLGNPVYIDFPTDGGPNIIAGVLKATTLEVSGDPATFKAATFFQKSVLEQNAEMRLGVGILEPPDSPGVTQFWPRVNIDSGYEWWRPGVYSGGNFYLLDDQVFYTRDVKKVTPAGVVTHEQTISTPGGFSSGTSIWGVRGVTKLGTDWYVLEWYSASGAGGTPLRAQVRKFNSSWVHQATWVGPTDGTHNVYNVTFGANAGVIDVVAEDKSSDDYTVYRVDASTMTDINSVVLPIAQTDMQASEYPVNVQMGDLGTGSGSDFFFVTNQRALWCAASNSGTTPTGITGHEAHDFTVPSDARGTIWDGTRFWTITDGSPSTIRKHSLAHADIKHWFAATKYNSVGPKETTLSDKYGRMMNQRKFMRITMSYPGATGGRIYMATGSSAPVNGSFELAATLASPVTAVELDSFSTITGAAPPGANNYTGGSPAVFKATGNNFSIDGDSNGSIGVGTFRDSARAIDLSNIQTGNYTPVATDAYKMIQMNVASPSTGVLTIPAGVFAVNQWFEVYWRGTGTISISGSLVTLNGRGLAGAITTMNMLGRHSVIRFVQRATDIWIASGDIGTVS